jgi:hypothetical protein
VKKCLELIVDGNVVCVAQLDDQTMASITVSCKPKAGEGDAWPFCYSVDGFQWGEQPGALEWKKAALDPQSKIEIRIGEPSRTPDVVKKTLVSDEKECGFCHRPAKDVTLMIEGDSILHRICSDCVKACMELVQRNAQ